MIFAVKERVSPLRLSRYLRSLAHSTMFSCHHIPLLLFLFLLSIFAARLSASPLISDAPVGHQVGNERRLLQVKKSCSINIENQNYTIIISQCKDPYPPEPCCSAFKEFACPIADEINDLSTDCAERMMTYITTIGKYPTGLFGSKCREGKDGLYCPAPPPSPTPNVATPMLGPCLFMPLLLLLYISIFV